MASAIYPKFKETILQGGVNMSSSTIKVAMVTSAYTYSATHQFYSSVTGVVGTPATLGNKTFTNGVFNADDVTFTNVAQGSTVNAIVIYEDSGSAATSDLIVYIDGLNILTNGGNITLQFQDIAPFIFTL